MHFSSIGIQLSVFEKRGILTKRVILGADGTLQKDSKGCAMSRGTYRRVTVNDMHGLDALLSGLTPQQAVAYGVARVEAAQVVARRDLPQHRGAISRTKDTFTYQSPAVFMLDYDAEPGAEPLTPDALRAMVIKAIPALADVAMLWRPSASSCIFDADGNEVIGISGQRLFFAVDRGESIPRIGETLDKLLWLAGHGRIHLSRSGAMLLRSPVDTSVFQGERLDFAAGAVCTAPLVRKPAESRVWDGSPCLHADLVPELKQITLREYKALVSSAKDEAIPGQAVVRDAYIEERAAEFDCSPAEARSTIKQALETEILGGDFPLHMDDGSVVNVAHVLADKPRYHGATLADPLEPEYGGGRGKARLYLSGTRPVIHSFAHGSRVYQLRVASVAIEVAGGNLHEVTEEVIKQLANEPDIFVMSSGLTLVEADVFGAARLIPINPETLTARVAATCSFWRKDKHGNPRDIDPPARMLGVIAKRRDQCGIRLLDAVVTAPTLRPDGSVLSAPGYDAKTRLLVMMDDEPPTIPEHPTESQIKAALDYLMSPFAGFDFAGELDQGVFVSAVLTAVVRRILPTAPGFVISASTMGTGKTKMAQCIDIIAGGTGETRSLPSDPDEMRKAITAVLIEGRPGIIFDNVTGHLRGDVLCAVLTSPSHSDRILGLSQSAQMSTRAMMLFTGNNLETAGDLSRRVLRVDLDPGVAEPWRRAFDFEPVSRVRDLRLPLVVSALTLLRGYIAAGRPRVVATHTGSFEEWSALVRSTVVWLKLADPERSIDVGLDADPETESVRDVMRAWEATYGCNLFVTTSEIAGRQTTFGVPTDPLVTALRNALNTGRLSPKSIGRWLAYRKNRVFDGRKFVDDKRSHQRGWLLMQHQRCIGIAA